VFCCIFWFIFCFLLRGTFTTVRQLFGFVSFADMHSIAHAAAVPLLVPTSHAANTAFANEVEVCVCHVLRQSPNF